MHKILVPTDFSTDAFNALLFAAEFAAVMHSEILVYHTDRRSGTSGGRGQDEVEKEMKAFVERIGSTGILESARFSTHIDNSELQSGIKRMVREEGCDLIIMGTKGVSGFMGKYLGSFTTETISVSVVPVLVIPSSAKWKAPETIVLALDRNEHYEKERFTFLNTVSENFSPSVSIIEMTDDSSEQKWDEHQIRTWLPAGDVTVKSIREEDVNQQIDQFVLEENADWAAVIPLANNLFEYIFNQSVSKRMALHTKVPLLVLK